ncbi:unnamed protein product [Arabidopsis lyrata]|nr:unnamed protein product [Arabidopsis lyrata]
MKQARRRTKGLIRKENCQLKFRPFTQKSQWGHSENRTRDLSHPKRESYH